jgi:hypothetical protein
VKKVEPAQILGLEVFTQTSFQLVRREEMKAKRQTPSIQELDIAPVSSMIEIEVPDLLQCYIERRKLRAVLEDWCPRIPGLFLYYPGHRHVPPGLKALIEVVKELNRSHSTASRPD